MRSGRWRMMAGMILAVVAAVAALIFYMSSGDDTTYSDFGRQVNGLHQEHFDQFWHCSFQGYDMKKVKNNADLAREINTRAARGRKRFAVYVRDTCLPKLADLEPGLQALIPPEDFSGQVRDLSASVAELRSGWSDFIAYVDGLGEEPYDEVAADEQVQRIAKGWYDYRRNHADINKKLREKLGRD